MNCPAHVNTVTSANMELHIELFDHCLVTSLGVINDDLQKSTFLSRVAQLLHRTLYGMHDHHVVNS